MNYIAHLTGFFRRVSRDHRFNPTHVSLYMALFQQWNLVRFRNPISVSRAEVMEVSRISSRVTYHKCIKELHAWGYLHYDPSYNHFRGSLVYMLGFDDRPEQDRERTADPDEFCTGTEPEANPGCTGAERELGPSTNRVNLSNFSNPVSGRGHARAAGARDDQEEVRKEQRKEKCCAAKEKKAEGECPPGLEEVRAFFLERGYRELEARRFFHHYSANGWRVGPVAMQDWQAAARKWMINGISQSGRKGPKSLENQVTEAGENYGTGKKNYSEPL